MRKALALLIGGIALGVAIARLRRRLQQTADGPPETDADPRAQELRDRLAETREDVATPAPPAETEASTEPAEAPADAAEPSDAAEDTTDAEAEAGGEDVGERRRKVHARGEAVAGEMRRRSKPKPKAKAKPEE